MAKDHKITVTLTRKQAAPRNAAAKLLREGQFQPRVETDSKTYTRRKKHKVDPVLEAARQAGDDE
ncbi:DUF7230 family protein [Devosia sp. A16]|uniref:DUF7230 family protein n=1 Tax=Devosia sp. A16 TaxID=1736675 RepID=UPI0006D81725|nr:hypothetical protein [Devosia sp. A16]